MHTYIHTPPTHTHTPCAHTHTHTHTHAHTHTLTHTRTHTHSEAMLRGWSGACSGWLTRPGSEAGSPRCTSWSRCCVGCRPILTGSRPPSTKRRSSSRLPHMTTRQERGEFGCVWHDCLNLYKCLHEEKLCVCVWCALVT